MKISKKDLKTGGILNSYKNIYFGKMKRYPNIFRKFLKHFDCCINVF